MHFFSRMGGLIVGFYAESVTFRSPGSAKPHCGRAPPWETARSESMTPKALHNCFGVTRVLVERLQRTGFLGLGTQGAQPAAAAPGWLRPWASECNRFAVQSLAALPPRWKSTENMHHSVARRGDRNRSAQFCRRCGASATYLRFFPGACAPGYLLSSLRDCPIEQLQSWRFGFLTSRPRSISSHCFSCRVDVWQDPSRPAFCFPVYCCCTGFLQTVKRQE
jgi:hypothetical protein